MERLRYHTSRNPIFSVDRLPVQKEAMAGCKLMGQRWLASGCAVYDMI